MSCPGENSLALLLAGRLAEASSAEVRAHVESCAACASLFELLRSAPAEGLESTPYAPRSLTADTQASPAPAELAVGDEAPRAGLVVGGRYRLERQLGEGGMGAVWAAEQVFTHERFALKMIRPAFAQRPGMRRRALREAQAASAVQHPNVVRVVDAFEAEGGTPVLVMELLVGETLGERIRRRGRLSLGDTARLMLPVLSAVRTAHAAGVIHRDLKPDNLFLVKLADGSEDVRVLDFGLARLLTVDASSSQLTRSGEMLGTPSYMSPEQSFGEIDLDERTDVWAVGVILYECLSGKRPFDGGNFGQVLKRITSGQRPPLGAEAPGLPDDVAALVDRMLTVPREARPRDLGEAVAVLTAHAVARGPSTSASAMAPADGPTERSTGVLVLAALREDTGEAATARRLARQLGRRHAVELVDAAGTTPAELERLAAQRGLQVAIGVDALVAGPLLRSLGLPYALVLGGADLYQRPEARQQGEMWQAVTSASRIVAFSPQNRSRAERLWPHLAGRIECIALGVDTDRELHVLQDLRDLDATGSTSEAGAFPQGGLREAIGLPPGSRLALLPSGLRRAQDPLHVVDAFSAWHASHPDLHLVVAGGARDEGYADEALAKMRDRPGVHHVGALARPRLLLAMRQATAVLNTSLSEGMCAAILDAMSVGTPVIARRNDGNESLIVHGHSGLLYDEPGELLEWLAAICNSRDLARRLARAARARVDACHSEAAERERYLRVIEGLAEGPVATLASADPVASCDAGAASLDPIAVVVPEAERLGLQPPIVDRLAELVAQARAQPAVHLMLQELSALLATAPPTVALAAVAARELSASLSLARARTARLALALTQVPAAEARLLARGVDESIVQATLHDLVEWSEYVYAQTGCAGLTQELLAWSQRYLRGELLRVGPLQFELRPFGHPVRVYRHRTTQKLSAVTLEGRPVDLSRGTVLDEPPLVHDHEWALALEPGSPVLEMWIAGSASPIDLRAFGRSLRAAEAVFERLAPETVPVGVVGESWRLDPQVLRFMPTTSGVQDLQLACQLLPGTLSEAQTLRRLFGPDVTRADLGTMDKSRLGPIHRAIADFLVDEHHHLRARAGFVLREELSRMPVWT